jgi:hypothetical protein
MGYMPGAKGLLYLAGAPVAGTDAVQTLTYGGTPAADAPYTLNVQGFQTAPILWSAVNATLLSRLQTALDGIPGLGAAQIVATAGTVVAGLGTVLLTYSGINVAKRGVPLVVVVSAPPAGTLVVANTTPGADANPPFPRRGALVMNEATGTPASNTGTAAAPTWTNL